MKCLCDPQCTWHNWEINTGHPRRVYYIEINTSTYVGVRVTQIYCKIDSTSTCATTIRVHYGCHANWPPRAQNPHTWAHAQLKL